MCVAGSSVFVPMSTVSSSQRPCDPTWLRLLTRQLLVLLIKQVLQGVIPALQPRALSSLRCESLWLYTIVQEGKYLVLQLAPLQRPLPLLLPPLSIPLMKLSSLLL